jgi:hypothetical protein
MVTVTSTVPLPFGEVASSEVGELTLKPSALLPPNLTVVAPLRSAPEIMTVVPLGWRGCQDVRCRASLTMSPSAPEAIDRRAPQARAASFESSEVRGCVRWQAAPSRTGNHRLLEQARELQAQRRRAGALRGGRPLDMPQ